VGELSVRRAVAQFAVTGLVAVLLLGLLSVQLLRTTGRNEAIRDAKKVTRLAGEGIVAPRLTPRLATDKDAIIAMDALVRREVLREGVVRVKIWDGSGRVVYSDEHRLIGSRYRLGRDEIESLEQGTTEAEVSDLAKPENRFERRYGKLLEVYRGIRVPGDGRLLFETYQRYSSIAASGRRLWLRFAPALAGALLLLELVQIPLALLLARRLRERERERRVLLQRAVDASDAERRRIAATLHDGPVQSLAGMAFGLEAAAERARGSDGLAATLHDAARRARETMRELRTMLVELYPATLRRSGLGAAMSDLLGRAEAAGLETSCELGEGLELSEEAEGALFRAAREAVQNAVKHAGAQHLEVRLERAGDAAVLTVVDDGRGFDPKAIRARDGDGHLGLRMLADSVDAAGGRFDLRSAPGAGTRVRVEVPAG
jgi:signal transduction histidine kinase